MKGVFSFKNFWKFLYLFQTYNMPFSTPVFKEETIKHLFDNYKHSSTILDIGAGAGYYSKLLKHIFPNMDAIEIFEPYIGAYQLESKYKNVWNENVLTFEFDHYDIILMGDVLEHIEESEGIELVKKLYPKCNELVIAIPFNAKQGEYYGNIYETHLQAELTHESFLEKYEGFKPLEYRYDYGVYIKE
jgi:SAM-dependent methyltransferase